MPGPMGGGRGGGFSGGSRGGGFSGGSHGGGFSGGSRGGGGMHHGPMHHGPHHHHHHGPMFWGPRFHGPYRRGGIYIGGFAGAAFALIICAIFAMVFIASFFSGGVSYDPNGNIIYDEAIFQSYANSQYFTAFSETDNYEENILIVFTVYEGYDGYECIPWGGNEIDYEINEMFGDYFQSCVKNAIPGYYEYALPSGFKSILGKMANKVATVTGAPAGDVDTSFSKLYNNSELVVDPTEINKALVDFTNKTGINIAIVIDDGIDVFGEQEGDVFGAIIGLIFIVGFVVVIIFSMKKKSSSNSSNKNDKTDPDAGQGKYDPNTGTWK